MYVPADHANSCFVSEQELVVSAKGFVMIVLLLYVPVFFKIGPLLSADLITTSFICLTLSGPGGGGGGGAQRPG